jgi:glucosamine--fructose-6-phosphate aminotransferase (isomerizing)
LRSSGETAFVAGGPADTLPWIGDNHPIYDAAATLLLAYAAIEAAACGSGLDPDKLLHLSKVTRTL